jgi:hypothetical protein
VFHALRIHQHDRAQRRVHHAAQALLVALEFGVLLTDAREHLIEGAREHQKLRLTDHRCAHRIIGAFGNRARRVGERQHRPRNLSLQDARQQVREQQRRGKNGGGDHSVLPQPFIQRAHVRTNEQRTEALLRMFADRLEARQRTVVERVTRRPGRRGKGRIRRIPGIAREQASVLVIQRRDDDVRLGLQCGQHFLRIFTIAESERSGAVGGDDTRQCACLLQAAAAERNVLVDRERSTRQQQNGSAGEQHHRRQLAMDGKSHVLEKRRKKTAVMPIGGILPTVARVFAKRESGR